MSQRLRLVSLTLSLLMLSSTAAAQLPQLKQETDEEQAKARKELERKALVMLDETLAGAQTLKLAENRATIRVQAADLLWPRDEKRARALFRDAAADIASALGQEDLRRTQSGWMLMQLRSQLLFSAASRDAQFALELLRDSRPAAAEEGATQTLGDPEAELRLEQSIVAQAAESDPKAVLRLAEESLDKGVTFGVLGILERLRQKDAESATKLTHKIVERLRGQSLTDGREAFSVAASLLHMIALPNSGERFAYLPNMTPQQRAAEPRKPLVMDDGDVRELSELVAAAALKDASATGAYGLMLAVRPLLPELEKRVPARAAQLRRRLAEMDKSLDPRQKAWTQFETLIAKPPEAMLEEAAKAPAEVREQVYSMAAMKLLNAGDTERARQVVSDNLRGAEREQMLGMVEQAEITRAVEKGDTNAARGVVAAVKSKERRARALAELAVAFALKGDKKTAGQLLEEARGLVDRQPDDEKEMEALLEVARGYALVEPSKTFEMIDPLIDHANDLLMAAALLEKFGQGGGIFRKGEMILAPGLGELSGAHARYVKALAELARVDFERTRAAADRFNRDEARLMARIIVARSVLSDRLDPPGAPGARIVVGHSLSAQ